MTRFLLVAAGGAIGSTARYAMALFVASRATLVVNLIGSLLIGLVMELMPPGDLRLFLVTGILGGFTTYSAFNQETLELLRSGAWTSAFANVAVTLIGCLIAGLMGVLLARAIR